MNNSVFGKTMENIRNRVDIRFCTNEKQLLKLVNKSNFERRTIFSENFIAVHMKQKKLFFNKPIYLGASILDLSKKKMYEFHYDYMKPKYGKKLSLLYTDTDSFIYEIKTEDLYEDIKPELKKYFDTSEFQEDHPSELERINKKVLGKMKFETKGLEIKEFVGLRPKSYSFLMDNEEENKICKGIKKSVINQELSFKDYKNCLLNNKKEYRTMNILRSYKHEIYAEEINKVALCPNDDKRFIRECGIKTYSIDHYKINK